MDNDGNTLPQSGTFRDSKSNISASADHSLSISEGVSSVQRQQWTCFHCGDTFTDPHDARLHFGRDERSEAACIIKAGAEGSLLKALRDAEYQADDAIQRMHDESTDAAKAYHQQRCRHTQALIAAEELGYERGLTDGRLIVAEFIAWFDKAYPEQDDDCAYLNGGGWDDLRAIVDRARSASGEGASHVL